MNKMRTMFAILLLSATAAAQFGIPPANDPWWKSKTGKDFLRRERADMSRWASDPEYKQNFAAYCYWSQCDPYQLDISKSLKKFYAKYKPSAEPQK